MPKEFAKFWITQAGMIIKDNKCLVVEFADRPGAWDIPGGRIDVGEEENSEESFRREIKEELGIDSFDIVDLVAYDIWMGYKGPQGVCALIFLIDNPNTYDIKLSEEHISYKWISEDEIKEEFFWPGATKMLKKGFQRYRELKNKKDE